MEIPLVTGGGLRARSDCKAPGAAVLRWRLGGTDRTEAGSSSGPQPSLLVIQPPGQRVRDGMGGTLGALRQSGELSCLDQNSLCPSSCPTTSSFLPICSSHRKFYWFSTSLIY